MHGFDSVSSPLWLARQNGFAVGKRYAKSGNRWQQAEKGEILEITEVTDAGVGLKQMN